jgi:hypothetical protein
MMVVEEIGKGLFSNQETSMLPVVPARDLGQREANFGQPDEARVFGLIVHSAFFSQGCTGSSTA